MSRNDWIGLGVSLGLHLLLLLGFALMTTASKPPSMGFVEVEFGEFALGQAVEQHPEEVVKTEPEPAPEPEPEPEVKETPRAERPINLPDEPEPILEEETIPPPPEAPLPEPEPLPKPKPETKKPPAPEKKEVKPLGSGRVDGTTGQASGDPGEGTDARRQAPYLLEGLNRTPVFAPLPDYPEQVEAVIQYRITVDPEGKIIRMIPIRKGNPALEAAVQEALRKWRFNPLKPGVPRENQTGTITFRFRLR